MNRPFKIFLAVCLIGAASQTVFAQQSESRPITLAEAVQIATSQNPNVQIAIINSDLAQQDQKRALSALLPQASVGLGESIQRINVETSLGTTAGLLPLHEGPFQGLTTGTRFSVPIFNLKNIEHYLAQEANRLAATADIDTVREQMASLTVSQYLLGIRLTETVKAAESQVTLAQSLFDQAREQEKAGTGTGLDTLRAQQRLKVRQQALIVAREQEQTSRFALIRFLNFPPTTELVLTDEDSLNSRAIPNTESASIQSAWQQRPEMIALKKRIVAAQRDLASSRGERWPSLSIDGHWYEEGNRFNNSIPVYQYQAALSLPVFTGGRTSAEIASSNFRIKRLQEEAQELRNQIALEVKTARVKLESALQEVQVADAGLQLAKEEVDQAQSRFHSGVGDNVEVVTAQDTLARAYDDRIAALYRVSQSRADLERAIGRIRAAYMH